MYTVHVTESQVIYVLYVIEDHRIWNLENGRKWIWHFKKQKTWDFTLIYIIIDFLLLIFFFFFFFFLGGGGQSAPPITPPPSHTPIVIPFLVDEERQIKQ